jgi:hypothetical protein
MPTIDEMVRSALEQLLGGGPEALEEQIYQRGVADIDRGYQQRLENAFGRGFGLSTVQGANEQARAEALLKLRTDAALASRQATLSALGTAAGQQNRQQQESQFSRNQDMQRRQMDRQQDIADNQMLAQGIGGLGGAALQVGGLVYGPEIKGALRRLVGGGDPGQSRYTGQLGGDLGATSAALSPDILDTMDFSIPDFTMPDVGGSFDLDLSVPDFALDPGNFDLGGGMDFAFDFGDSAFDRMLRGLEL